MKNDLVFNFDSEDIKKYIQYDLNLLRKISKSFNYIQNTFKKLGHFLEIDFENFDDLEKANWRNGKNYDWLSIVNGNIELLIRQYRYHFTIYSKLTIDRDGYTEKQFSCFTFNTNTDLITDKNSYDDSYYEDNYYELNKHLKAIFEIIRNDDVRMISNPYTLIRPKHCEVSMIFSGESMYSIDKLIFCAEELSNLHIELFSENEMLEKLKDMNDRVGLEFDRNSNIDYIKTELKNNYYHDVGIGLIDKNDNKKSFKDVYCLTMYYFTNIFTDNL